jgi:hypothetical protein
MSRSTWILGFLLFLLLAGTACSLNQRLLAALREPTSTRTRRMAVFPAIPPTPAAPVATAPLDMSLVNLGAPGLLPTLGANSSAFISPVAAPALPSISPIATPASFDLSAPISPLAPPTPAPPPMPAYDFLLAEFFNSPTTNSFMMVYVAIVDPQEIPIGDMKIIGTRLDQNLTYESPLSKWHYEGYSAPGEVVKSGNVKFEPPGGLETTDWVLHLEDSHGNRQSEDIPFHVDAENKQWYFIKLRRIF